MDNFVKRVGVDLSYGGFILSNGNETYLVPLPEEYESILDDVESLIDHPDSEKNAREFVLDTRNGLFEEIVRQTDLVEVEVKDGNQKIIVRKSQRQLDSIIQWKVFQRDNYSCRYCNRTGLPLTVDHLITWETGGQSSEENLVAACRKCNKTRGNMSYENWLSSDYYQKISKKLPQNIKDNNVALVEKIKSFVLMTNKRSR